MKVNHSDNKVPHGTTLIHINQYNIDKQRLEIKIGDVDTKIPNGNGLVTTTILNTETGEVGNKIPDISGLVTSIVVNTKITKNIPK